jgi:hypothetical protein
LLPAKNNLTMHRLEAMHDQPPDSVMNAPQ